MYINIFIFDLQRGPINRLHEAQDAGNRVRRAQFYHFTGVAVNIKRRGGGERGGERRGRNDIKLIRDPRGRGGRGGGVCAKLSAVLQRQENYARRLTII